MTNMTNENKIKRIGIELPSAKWASKDEEASWKITSDHVTFLRRTHDL